MTHRLHVSISFKWYDLWIGVYWDRPGKALYVCLLPMLPIKIWKSPTLHVFANEVIETVIAYDAADAIKVWEETTGEKYSSDEGGEGGGPFEQVPDDYPYTLTEEELREPDPAPRGGEILSIDKYGTVTTRAPARAWADARGRCYLGSTEY